MKNRIEFLLTLLFLIPQFLLAQSTGSLKGKLLDESKQAIAYATISLFNTQDELIMGAISDEKGAFALKQLPLDSLQVEVQYLGFETFRKAIVINKQKKKVNLGEITMTTEQQQLDEVTITADKSQFSLRLDKKVFQVGKDVLSQGGSAIDILDQVPLVSVDPNGTVSLRGSNQVQILINGRRSGLTMNNALDQIASDNIERVEVITNPSAGFDANGSAGIINIILKKNKNLGWNGQVRATVGVPANHVIMPGINYKGKKINLFSNLRWRYSDYNGTYRTTQRTTENGKTSFLNQLEDEDRHDDGRSGYFGADYYINDKNSITAAYFRAETKDTDETFINYDLKNEAKIESTILRTGNSVENRNYNQLETNYTRTFNQKGQKFTVDFQYDFWNSNKDWDLLTTGDAVPSDIRNELRTNNKAGSKDYMLKSDYVKPLKNGGIIELGAKVENRIVKNDYLAEVFTNDTWTIYGQIDNDIKYSEKVGAAYLQYKSSVKKLEYSFGLRSEYTLVDISDDENIFTENKDYLNLFPSVHLSYPLNEGNTIQWSYSRRINRPSLWRLYPFSEIKDFNLQEIGNPNLESSFTDGLEISFLHVQDKLTLNPGVYYRHTNNPFSNFLDQNEQQTFIVKPINIDQKDELGFELSLKYQPIKIINLNAEFNYFHFDEKGTYLGQNLDASGDTWHTRFTSNINLSKNIRFQSQFDYYAPEQDAQTRELATYVLSFGMSKNFLNDKLNIGIRAFNVLDSRKIRTISESDTYYMERSSKRYGQRFSISFLYKINQTERDRMRQAKRQNR